MNDKPEPRSNIKSSNVWNSPFRKTKKTLWNFRGARDRGQLPELPTKIKQIGFNSKIYQWGQYCGPLEDLKGFAKIKGISTLTCGAVKYRVA